MNTSQGALYFGAGIDLTQFNRDLASMRAGISGLTQTVNQESRNIDSAFKNLSIGIASYFSVGAIKSFVTELINVRGEFQKTEIAFSTMLKSEAKAAELMGEMVDLAAKTPFSLQEVSAGAKQLLAFQIPANQVVDVLTRMGNIAAGLGVPLSRINLVYGQVKAKGKLMGDDLRQFTEAGIPMVAELAKKFNKTTGEIQAMVSAGKIGFKDVQDVLFSMTNEGGMFFNLMEKQSKSLSGQVANLGDAWDQMLNKIGEGQEGILSDGIQGLIYLVEHYEAVGKAILTLVEIYGAYRAALIVTSLLQSSMTSPAIIQGFANLIKIIRGVTVAQETLNAATIANPYVLVATLIAALIAVTYNYRTEIGELLGIIQKQTTAQKAQEAVMNSYNTSFGKGVSQTKASISELINIIRNENSSLAQRKQAYDRLIAIDPAFRGTLDAQYRSTRKLGEALEFVTGKIDAFAMAQAKAAAARKYLEESFEEQFKAGALKTQVMDADAEAKKWRKLDEEARKSGKASLDYMRKATDAEKKRDELAKKWREQQDIANEKGSISNTIIRNNNTEISQKEKQLSLLEKEIKLGRLSGEVLDLKKKQAEKLKYELSGFKPEIIKDEEVKAQSLGYVEQIEAKIDELKIAYSKALTPQAARSINVEIAKWQAKLDALNPKKDKKDNKQLSEIFPTDSIKDLERKAQLITDALQTVENGVVKLRKLDKYGNDKDKKGNPLLTGENVSVEEAKNKLIKVNEALEAKRKEIEVKSFQERIDETKRQIEVRDKLLKFGYSKETVDTMFPEVKDKSFLQYLNDTSKSLEKLNNKQSVDNLVNLQNILTEYTGSETFIENVNKQIETLKAKFNGNELIDKLEKFKKANLEGTTADEKNSKNIAITKAQQAELDRQKNLYQEFLNEEASFQKKKTDIQNKYDLIRKQIADSSMNEDQKKSYTDTANKNQAKEISSVSFEAFKKTDLWVKAFGDLDKIGPKTLAKLKKGLQDYLKANQGTLQVTEIKETQDQIKKLDDIITSNNPYKAIGVAVDLYKKKRQELNDIEKKSGKDNDNYREKLEETQQTFVGVVEVTGKAANAMVDVIGSVGGVLDNLSDDLKQTLSEVQQLVEGIFNAVSGYFSGNYAKMISGIVQIVGSVSKLLNGDNDKERHIKSWQKAVEDLKSAYTELQYIIEQTAGEEQIAKQREVISNLKEQQKILQQMKSEENAKKKEDQGKIDTYNQQINDINLQIQKLIDDFKTSVTTTNFKDLSENIANALIDAFGKGEDAAASFEKVVDDVMRNAVANALKIKILQPAVESMVDQLYASMGYGSQSGATAEQAKLLQDYQNQILELDKKLVNANPIDAATLNAIKKDLLERITVLKQQIASNVVSGSFDGLTDAEREAIKATGQGAMQQYMDALKQYEELFGASAENAQGLKGDIKGITEKTAGALEGQFNAVRINIVAVLKIMQGNQIVSSAQTAILSQIEVNTRNLHQMKKDLSEMNSKIKPGLAGIP